MENPPSDEKLDEVSLMGILQKYTVTKLDEIVAHDTPLRLSKLTKYDRFYTEELDKIIRQKINILIKLELKNRTKSDNPVIQLYHNLCQRIEKIHQLKYFFVTVNFDDKKVLPLLQNHQLDTYITKKCQKSFILDYIYCIEQRGIVPRFFNGYHTHILFQLSKKKSKGHIIRDFYSGFKSLVGSKESIDVRDVTYSVKEHINYVHGIKKGVEKKKKSKCDISLRNTFILFNTYTSNEEKYRLTSVEE